MADKSFIAVKAPNQWTVREVGIWLGTLNLDEYKTPFEENVISGAELMDMTEPDMISIGMKKLGLRKKCIAAIAELKVSDIDGRSKNDKDYDDDLSGTSSLRDLSSSMGSSTSGKESIKLKVAHHDNLVIMNCSRTCSLDKFKVKVTKEFGFVPRLQFKDEEGDVISINKTKVWVEFIKKAQNNTRVIISRAKSHGISKRDADLLRSAKVPTIVCDTVGKVQLFNTAAEELFGYKSADVRGKNVKYLMPTHYAREHDKYMQNYLKSGIKKAIDTTRSVVIKQKNGNQKSQSLSLVEVKTRNRHYFIGKFGDDEDGGSAEQALPDMSYQYAMYENLLDPIIIINEKGIIQFINSKVIQILGYTVKDLVNKNVKLIMPPEVAEKHDTYLSQYLKTGKSSIIGNGRIVVAVKKDGTLLKIDLNLTEQKWSSKNRWFIGVLRKADVGKSTKTGFLQNQRLLLENLPIATIVIDSMGIVQIYNPAAANLFGHELKDIAGRNIKMLIPPGEVLDKHDEYLSRYLKTRKSKEVVGAGRAVVALHQCGTLMDLHLSVNVNQDGDKIYYIGVFQELNM